MLKKLMEWPGLGGGNMVQSKQCWCGPAWALAAFSGLGNADSVQTHVRGATFSAFGLA
jgi:hypothetical protein